VMGALNFKKALMLAPDPTFRKSHRLNQNQAMLTGFLSGFGRSFYPGFPKRVV